MEMAVFIGAETNGAFNFDHFCNMSLDQFDMVIAYENKYVKLKNKANEKGNQNGEERS